MIEIVRKSGRVNHYFLTPPFNWGKIPPGLNSTRRCVKEHRVPVQNSTTKDIQSKEIHLSTTNRANGTSPSPSFSEEFVSKWHTEFEAKFGRKYKFQSGKDGSAVKQLARLGVAATQLMELAKFAWKNDKDWHCNQAGDIAGFASQYNHIVTAQDRAKRRRAAMDF
jgi:hypothetical protein